MLSKIRQRTYLYVFLLFFPDIFSQCVRFWIAPSLVTLNRPIMWSVKTALPSCWAIHWRPRSRWSTWSWKWCSVKSSSCPTQSIWRFATGRLWSSCVSSNPAPCHRLWRRPPNYFTRGLTAWASLVSTGQSFSLKSALKICSMYYSGLMMWPRSVPPFCALNRYIELKSYFLCWFQVRVMVLIPLVQLPVQVVLGGLGGGLEAWSWTPQAQVRQGDPVEVLAPVIPPEGGRRCPRKFPGSCSRPTRTGRQI